MARIRVSEGRTQNNQMTDRPKEVGILEAVGEVEVLVLPQHVGEIGHTRRGLQV